MSITFSWYFPGDSFLHRVNPAVKLVWLGCMWLLVFVFQHPLWNGLIVAIVLVLMIFARIPFFKIKSAILIIVPVMVLFCSLWPFVMPGGATYFTAVIPIVNLRITMSELGLIWGFTMALRLLGLTGYTLAVLVTTSETEMVAGLLTLKIPYIGAFLLTLIFRFLSVVGGDVLVIQEAQRARGLPEKIGIRTIPQMIRNAVALLVPLVLVSVRRIQLITNAIDVRAYKPGAKRTFFHTITLGYKDYFMLALPIIVLITAMILRYGFGLLCVIPGRL